MRVIELIFVLVAIIAHLAPSVNSKVVRNRIWVEARAPTVNSRHHTGHHRARQHHNRPLTQAYTHNLRTLSLQPTKNILQQEHHHKKPSQHM